MRRGKCNQRHAACNRQLPDNMRHAAGNMQRTANMQRATGNMRQTSSNMQRTTPSCNATCSMQHATGNVRHATGILEKTIDSRQQGNEATRQHATRGMQQTPRKRRQNQTTHATDNVQQTADDMQEDASTCEMQQETHSTAAFRVRRAAGSAQPAACAKHCTRQPVRNTADATHKMQHTTGAAACSKHTRNQHHAADIETYEMRRTESGRSLLEAAPAGAAPDFQG